MLLHELKKVQLQEHFMLMTWDSIGHLKMPIIFIYIFFIYIYLFIYAEWWRGVWMEMLQLTPQRWKNAKHSSMNPA